MTSDTVHKTRKAPRQPIRIKFTHLVVVIILAVILWYAWGWATPEPDYTEFAQCLSDNGAVMYGTYWCSHCKAQKAEFGDAFSYVDYVECTENPDVCTEAGIRGYPSWIINGQKYEGVQPFERLGSLTQCPLPE